MGWGWERPGSIASTPPQAQQPSWWRRQRGGQTWRQHCSLMAQTLSSKHAMAARVRWTARACLGRARSIHTHTHTHTHSPTHTHPHPPTLCSPALDWARMFGQGEVGEVLEEHGEQAKLAEGLANSALALSHYQSSTGEGGVWGCGGCATTRAARVRGDCGGVGVAGSWVGEGCVWGGCGGLGGCFALSHYQRPRAVHPPTPPKNLPCTAPPPPHTHAHPTPSCNRACHQWRVRGAPRSAHKRGWVSVGGSDVAAIITYSCCAARSAAASSHPGDPQRAQLNENFAAPPRRLENFSGEADAPVAPARIACAEVTTHPSRKPARQSGQAFSVRAPRARARAAPRRDSARPLGGPLAQRPTRSPAS